MDNSTPNSIVTDNLIYALEFLAGSETVWIEIEFWDNTIDQGQLVEVNRDDKTITINTNPFGMFPVPKPENYANRKDTYQLAEIHQIHLVLISEEQESIRNML